MSAPTPTTPLPPGERGASPAALIAGVCCFLMATIDLFWTRQFYRLTSVAFLGAALWIGGGGGLILARRRATPGLPIAGASAMLKGLLAWRAAFVGAPPLTFLTLGLLWLASGVLAIAGYLRRGPSPSRSLRLVGGAAVVVGLLAFFDGYPRFRGSASALIKFVVALRTGVWFVFGAIAFALASRHPAPPTS